MNKIINKDFLASVDQTGGNNLILIDKPMGWTSFDVVKKIKRVGGFKKVGHGGTLDPFATGLLILGTGKTTKQLDIYSNADKSYEAIIEFGIETDTYDVTGNTVYEAGYVDYDEDLIVSVVNSFIGEYEQTPPMFSAKKINGQRLYKLARKGQVIERKTKKVFIKEIKIIENNPPFLRFLISCSKGTYIRSLAYDIGRKCGYGAYVKKLKRIEVNGFNLEQALSIAQFESLCNPVK